MFLHNIGSIIEGFNNAATFLLRDLPWESASLLHGEWITVCTYYVRMLHLWMMLGWRNEHQQF